MRIFVDFGPRDAAFELLMAGTAGHELVFPQRATASVLETGTVDPAFRDIDIAFGQPPVEAVTGEAKLRWIQASTAGITRYDTLSFRRLLRERGVVMTNSSSVYAEPCAAHALAFLLAHERQLVSGLQTITPNGSPAWNGLRAASGTLRGRKVLIVGFGSIARILAAMLEPHGAVVLGYRRQPRGDEGVTMVDDAGLSAALAEADHVVNILPDHPDTAQFFGAARLGLMRPGAAFHNIGRGTTVDQRALAAALNGGRLAAAWLDVTEPEPLPADHPLRLAQHCHITPHTAGGHGAEQVTLVRHFLDNLRRFEAGEPLRDRVE